MKRNILFSWVLLALFSISGKTFSQTQTFPDGLSIVRKYDRADTLSSSPMNARGYNSVIPCDGKHVGYVNLRWSVVDAAGDVIIPEGKNVITRIGDVFVVRNGGRKRLIDPKGKTIGEYDFLTQMPNDFYKVRQDGLWGVVDPDGKMIVTCEYDLIGDDLGSYKVRKNGKWGVIDAGGKMIVPCKYDFIANEPGLCRVRKDKKWGVIDTDGKMIIPCEYDVLLPASEYGVFIVRKDDYFGCIDKNNRVLLDFKYIYINPFVDGIAEACESEELIMVNNPLRAKRLEKKGYVWLKHPYSYMSLCKNPVYSQLKIEELKIKN